MFAHFKIDSTRAFIGGVWRLVKPYFQSEEKWRARALFAAIVVLNLAAVGMLVLINDWNRLFYDALENKAADVFWVQLGRFAYLALGFMVIAVYKFYLTQTLELRWRAWLTRHLLQRWLAQDAFYRLEHKRFATSHAPLHATGFTPTDNPDQRIQEDVAEFTNLTVGLSMGLLNAVVTLMSFVGILWALSGDFAFSVAGQDWHIPGFMVWMALLYCVLGSVLTQRIGRPLAGLNFTQQRREADFRHHLIRVREHSEAIALDRGAQSEGEQLKLRFEGVMRNALALLKAQKNLTWFTTGFGQAAVVFPFLVAAPRFFSGAIQLGVLMQIASAFGRVQDALSWFVESYDRLATWRATTDRLTQFDTTLDALASSASTAPLHTRASSHHCNVENLSLSLPNGTLLVQHANLNVQAGQRIVLQGPSGCGKSTLFRALAGIWPNAQGRLVLPANLVFMPQQPYFPQGSLRRALTYPQAPQTYPDTALQDALVRAHLAYLVSALDEEAAWGQQLSGGEQQRLAMARVFLRQPAWVFADEATSALDAQTEHTLYQALIELVTRRGGGLVSITHRPALLALHTHVWQFEQLGPLEPLEPPAEDKAQPHSPLTGPQPAQRPRFEIRTRAL